MIYAAGAARIRQGSGLDLRPREGNSFGQKTHKLRLPRSAPRVHLFHFPFLPPIISPRLTLKITYPQTQPEGPSSETLLKSLWRHVCNYYFKPIEDNDIQRMQYLK